MTVDALSLGVGVVLGMLVSTSAFLLLMKSRFDKLEKEVDQARAPLPPRSPAPDAVRDVESFAREKGWAGVTELRGTMAGVFKRYSGEFFIMVIPEGTSLPTPMGRVLGDSPPYNTVKNAEWDWTENVVLVQAAKGYEDNIVVPKPGTHVQVLQDAITRKAYFIGIIN